MNAMFLEGYVVISCMSKLILEVDLVIFFLQQKRAATLSHKTVILHTPKT